MEELPYALLSHLNGSQGFPKQYESILKKHFHVVYLAEFNNNKELYGQKIQALLSWGHLPVVTKELLESLPNLNVVSSSGAGVDHMDLKLISSYGIKVTNTPGVGDDSTADMGMALMLASARNVLQGKMCTSLDSTFIFLYS